MSHRFKTGHCWHIVYLIQSVQIVSMSAVILSVFCQNLKYFARVLKVLNEEREEKMPRMGCDSLETQKSQEYERWGVSFGRVKSNQGRCILRVTCPNGECSQNSVSNNDMLFLYASNIFRHSILCKYTKKDKDV